MNAIPPRPPVSFTRLNDGLDHIREKIAEAEAEVAAGHTIPASEVLARLTKTADEMAAARLERKRRR